MARWRLTEPHYILTDPDTIWERLETDINTGRQVRKQYVVPAYFHHEIESDWTDKNERAVIVCDGHNPGKGDIIFKGEPTPGMKALDDEAIAISAKFEKKWNIPDNIKWGDGQYSSALADHFVQEQERVNMRMSQVTEQNTRNLEEYMKAQGLQQAQVIKILEMLAAGKANGERNGEEGSAGENYKRPAGGVRRRGRPFGSRRTQGARPGRPRLAQPGEAAGDRPEERGGDTAEPSPAGSTETL